MIAFARLVNVVDIILLGVGAGEVRYSLGIVHMLHMPGNFDIVRIGHIEDQYLDGCSSQL